MGKIKNLFSAIKSLFVWFYPFFGFLIILFFVKLFFLKNISFDKFTELLKILIWPFTVLIILFFFKKVVTYLFFSMNEFNFFGAKGNLKNINEVILEEVEKRFLKEKEEGEQKKMMGKLNTEINEKDGTAKTYLNVAKEAMEGWKNSIKQNNDLEKENKRLKEIMPNLSVNNSPLDVKNTELGSGEKIENLTLGNPQQKI